MALLLYPRRKEHPLVGRTGGSQIWSGVCGAEKKKFFPLLGIKSRPSSLWPVAIPTELSRLILYGHSRHAEYYY
jgi:hypothetical protein